MSRLLPVARVLLALSLLVGCSRAPESALDDNALLLTEVLSFQRHQVSTDLVSVPERIGLDTVGYGWWQQTGDEPTDVWLRLATEIGQLRLFSADADIEQLDIELSGSGSDQPQPHIRIRLNGKQLRQIPAPAGWTSLKIDVPPELVRPGINRLEFGQPMAKAKGAAEPDQRMRLKRVRVRSRSGRQLWPTRPQAILAAASEPSATDSQGSFEMPVASYLDLVLPLPAAARLEGRFEFQPQPRSAAEPVYVYVELLDAEATPTLLFHERFYKKTRKVQRLSLDLATWTGETVRLRIGTTGAGNGVVSWLDLGVTSPVPVSPTPTLPVISRKMAPRSGKLGRPDVVVMLLDAARADAFSPWGGPHPTPAVERLAASGTVFANATSTAPWTGQSVPSIMTGLFPDTLGVGPWGSQLPEGVPTLAELMTQAGYRTVLWSQHPLYSNHQSFRRGFEEFYRTPRGVYDAVPGSDNLLAEDRPTFAFIHVIPPHAPYTPPAPFRGAYSSWYEGKMQVDPARLNAYPRRKDPGSLAEEDRRYVFDRYLENAAFADDLVKRVLDSLTRAGRYDDALVIVLSDHGEAFLEHDHFLHTKSVHREMLHIPFVIKWPASVSRAEATVSTPVSMVDLVPTLVDGLQLSDEGAGFQGASLLPTVFAGNDSHRPVYAITRGGHGAQRPPRVKLMLEIDGWRLLTSVDRRARWLYRSVDDPLETHNLAFEHPLQVLLMRQAALFQWHHNQHLLHENRAVEAQVEALDPEMMEELEALGYLN